MPAARESVLQALFSQLQPLTSTITGLVIERNRVATITHFPTLVMRDGSQEVIEVRTYQHTYRMDVEISGVTKGKDTIGSAVNELYAQTLQQIIVNQTLGGKTEKVDEISMDLNLDRTEGRERVGVFSLILAIQYTTPEFNPFQTI